MADGRNPNTVRFGTFSINAETWHIFGKDGQRLKGVGVKPVRILKHIIDSKPNLVRGTDEAIVGILSYYRKTDQEQKSRAFMQYISTLRRAMGPDEFDALFPNISKAHDVEVGIGGYRFVGEVLDSNELRSGNQISAPPNCVATLQRPSLPVRHFNTKVTRFAAPILMSVICLCITSDQFHLHIANARPQRAVMPDSPLSSSVTVPRTKILVLEFDGPDPKKYQVGHIVATALEQAKLTIGEDVDIEGSDQIISATGDAGVDEARKIGRARNATAVIWGYMGSTTEAPLYASFVPINGEAGLPGMPGVTAALVQIPIRSLEQIKSKYQLADKLSTLVRITVGLARMQRGDFDGFAQEMDQAVQRNPTNNELIGPGYLYLYHAISRLCVLDSANAIKDLTRVASKRSDPGLLAMSLALKGKIYTVRRDFINLNAMCQQVHRIATAPIEATSLCGQMYWEFGDQKSSSLFIKDLLTKTHPSQEELSSRIRLHVAFCQYDKANEDLEYARSYGYRDLHLLDYEIDRINSFPKMSTDPGILLVHDRNGMNNLQAAFLYQQMQRYDLAIQAANRVLDQVPSSTAYVARAASEALIGDKKHSIQDLDQAIAREPNNSNLYELRAIEYDDDGRYKEELADLDVAVKLDPSNAEFQAQIAGALFSLGRKQEGYKHLQMALSLQPTYVEAYFQLGTQKLYDKSYLDAFQDFTTEINLIRGNTPPFGYPLVNILGRCPPQNITMRRDHEASSLVLRSSAAMGSRHYSSAECDLEEALQLDPSDAGNHAMRSILAERENDYQRALTEIDKAIGFDSSEKQYRSSRERILRELKMKK